MSLDQSFILPFFNGDPLAVIIIAAENTTGTPTTKDLGIFETGPANRVTDWDKSRKLLYTTCIPLIS